MRSGTMGTATGPVKVIRKDIMKKTFLIIIILLVSVKCYGNVYVWTDKLNNEVIFIDEVDSVVISSADVSNIEKTILPKDIEFYGLEEAYTDYKLINGKFILNTKKISDRENEKITEKEKEDKKQVDFESAKTKLMSATWTPLTSDEVDSLR